MADFVIRTDEHRLLRETAVRVFSDPVQIERNLIGSGLLALPFAESEGGLRPDGSSDLSDLAIAFAAKGEAYAIDGLLLQTVLGGGLLAATSTPEKNAIVQGIIGGIERVATALHEPQARTDIHHCATRASRTGTGWTLDGAKTLALGAEDASRLIVLARTRERFADPRQGLSLFLLKPTHPGLSYRHYLLRDGSPASDVTLSGVELDGSALIADPDIAAAVVDSAVSSARLCLAAEASGLMRAALAGTAAYVAERKQFGQAIGSFQVIQHRQADMATLTDQASAMVAEAAANADDIEAVARAHRAVSEMGMMVAKAAIQLHGGYGMTEDLPYGRALRRMMTAMLLF